MFSRFLVSFTSLLLALVSSAGGRPLQTDRPVPPPANSAGPQAKTPEEHEAYVAFYQEANAGKKVEPELLLNL
jgi:hypothetical protein